MERTLNGMSLTVLLPGVLNELQRQTRKSQYLEDPVKWTREYLGIQLWSKQREILYSIRDNRATAVAAGHGTGKTYVAAIAAGHWVDVHPVEKTFVASTAPTVDQVSLLWDNIRIIYGIAEKRYKEHLRRVQAGEDLGEYWANDHPLPGYITGDNKWKREDGSLLGQGRKPEDRRSDVAFQGRHADYLLAIGDEAVGLPEPLINALGVIATGVYNRQLLIANPTDPSCAMAKIWSTNNPGWHRMHISVFDSPRITPEEGFDADAAPGLSGMEFVDQARSDYGGEDDPRYIARVLGQWAFDSGNTVYTEDELMSAADCHVRPDPAFTPELGVDVARMGSDATIVYRIDHGEVWKTDQDTGEPTAATGKRGVLARYEASWSKAPLTGSDPLNLGSAERIDKIAREIGAKVIKIDASGIGGGVIDGLKMLNDGAYTVIEIFGGARPTDRRQYVNSRAEGFFDLKKRFRDGVIDVDPRDELLLDELRGIQYEYSDKGPIKIESKDSMKRRGKKSPDRADALWYACYDAEYLLKPEAAIQPGQRVMFDPYQFTGSTFEGAGLPV